MFLPTTVANWQASTTNADSTFATTDRWPGSEAFEFTGGTQRFTVPAGYTEITIEAWGAQGGGNSGGRGGYARATVPVTPGDVLEIRVGGSGGQPTGGYNGGGSGGAPASAANGYGGGGASDVRRGAGLGDRLVVAGGGGGRGGGVSGSRGGDGGGETGTDGESGTGRGRGATQTAGGSGGGSGDAGTQGLGGSGARGGLVIAPGGGGGGGGWFGGGGGSTTDGGGGGSGYVGSSGATATELVGGVRAGHGRVVIHWGPPALLGP
ncbi:hypothetical protein FTX61_20380 [Nitriliruptoraceae bacterium ZYF776]|nr:hypothetical protein [Profundirhabdus halotolerans]